LFLSLWFASLALAGESQPVVAMGDGLVAAPASASVKSAGTVPGGWVTVLQDCLDEGAPAKYTVVDRAVPGETAKSARERVAGVVELTPELVVVALGAQELGAEQPNPGKFRKDLKKLVEEIRVGGKLPAVLLVGMVSPTLAQAAEVEKGTQGKIDELTSAWNTTLSEFAGGNEGVEHIDLWTDWPRDRPERAGLTVDGWHLSDQGHARVGAAVCDAVMAPKED